jgi:putative ABC transport system permease protein
MNLVVETEVAARSIQGAIEHEIHEIDPQLPVENVHTLAELRADTVGPERFRTILVSLFAGLALALSAIGIYGVLSYSVARRTREMGLRMSLGARTGDVLRLVIRQGMTLTLVGVAIGIALSALATGLLSSLLFEVSPTDPATFAGVSLVLSLVALLACLVPAWRATRADPVIALRTE